jgi:threonine/homoserine/homoserine lactone efflux protein
MNISAFLSYIILTAFTPGPNNIMAMTNSARVGLRRGMIFCTGILCGFLIDMSLCALLTSALFEQIPSVTPVMKWVGALYILFLALSIFRDKPAKPRAKRYLQPDGMVTGMIMQFVNIKVILYGITALSSFVLPYSRSFVAIICAVIILSLTGFAGSCCWTLFGSLFQRVFEKHRKLMNAVMALLLVYCAVMIVI